MVEAESLSKYYGAHRALDGLSFSIGRGEVLGFLGPNGAGKSTTMNILAGFLSLSEGNVRINGFDIFAQAREARACVGYLPEQPPLYTELTVREYLHHVCGLKKLPRKAWKAELERVLAMCGLWDVVQRRIAHLSKGYRQRVGLAQALVGNPPLLILDEPTAGLDPQQIQEFRKLLRQLSHEHTILLSSHILSEIEAVCQRVIILNRGQLIADDRTETLSRKINAGFCQLELEILLPHGPGPGAARQVASSQYDILAALLASQGVTEFRCRSEDELVRLDFQLPGSASAEPLDPLFIEPRRRLSQALTERGFAIIALKPRRRSLEDIFLDLTTPAQEQGLPAHPGLKGLAGGREAPGPPALPSARNNRDSTEGRGRDAGGGRQV